MHDLMGWWEFAFIPACSEMCSFPQRPKAISFLCPHLSTGAQKKQPVCISLLGFPKTQTPECGGALHAKTFGLVERGL